MTPQAVHTLGLLLLRTVPALMMLLAHGLPKLLGFSEKSATFSDPLGVGSTLSLSLAVGAEVGCAALMVLGLKTRWVALPLVFTMGVAFFVVHAADPFGRKEIALLYAVVFSSVALLGAGPWSLDGMLARRRS